METSITYQRHSRDIYTDDKDNPFGVLKRKEAEWMFDMEERRRALFLCFKIYTPLVFVYFRFGSAQNKLGT